MKKLLKLLLFVPVFITGNLAVAQNNNNWEPVFLTVSGGNLYDGVSMSWQKSLCNGQEVVYMRITNNNDYEVEITWFNAIFKQDLRWVQNEDNSKKKQLTLAAGASRAGDCSSENILKIVVGDFLTDPSEFFKFGVTSFNVSSK